MPQESKDCSNGILGEGERGRRPVDPESQLDNPSTDETGEGPTRQGVLTNKQRKAAKGYDDH